MSTKSSTTFLAIGDVHGHWSRVVEAIESVTDIHGHVPDLALQVGDAEALRNETDMEFVAGPPKYKWMGEFQILQSGDLQCPVYFIAGNYESYEALDAAESDATVPIPWGPNVFYLGHSGAMSIGSLNIAWLSGIESPNNLTPRRNGKAGYHYIVSDAEKTRREARRLSGVDVVITHDWPSGIRDGIGTDLISSLTHDLRPQLHVCGPVHYPREAEIFSTKAHALNAVPTSWHVNGSCGWWRLYRKENGQIRSLAVGGRQFARVQLGPWKMFEGQKSSHRSKSEAILEGAIARSSLMANIMGEKNTNSYNLKNSYIDSIVDASGLHWSIGR